MVKNVHNGKHIFTKHDTIFLGEEILEFFMVPTVKTHLSVLLQKIPGLQPGAKTVGDREILETHSNSSSKNTSETDIFPHGSKSLLASVIFQKPAQKIRVWLESDKNNKHFNWMSMYIYDNISASS